MPENWQYWILPIVLLVAAIWSAKSVFRSAQDQSGRPGGGCLVGILAAGLLIVYIYYTRDILFPSN